MCLWLSGRALGWRTGHAQALAQLGHSNPRSNQSGRRIVLILRSKTAASSRLSWKFAYTVIFDTPARSATKSMVVAAIPRSRKRSYAASRIASSLRGHEAGRGPEVCVRQTSPTRDHKLLDLPVHLIIFWT